MAGENANRTRPIAEKNFTGVAWPVDSSTRLPLGNWTLFVRKITCRFRSLFLMFYYIQYLPERHPMGGRPSGDESSLYRHRKGRLSVAHTSGANDRLPVGGGGETSMPPKPGLIWCLDCPKKRILGPARSSPAIRP